ncbi:PI-actitoxin-Aeq3a-like [Mercenaria mercenaria]|uniref:PI-actitoxin-Aeq3a-like n=1 Tax=Mercenaria mercenaria TaxID=6596 RepID=UPI00234F69A0|nr:PI-actitoxin-Aeq3a-like [Mercenaria mercenaria]
MIKIIVLLISVSVVVKLVLAEGAPPADTSTNGNGTVATDACQQPKVTGPCKGLFPRYFYNTQTSACEKFVYGGCWGNDNNFDVLEKCQTTCMSGK